MPTFYDPEADAAEAREAVRGLAHASRQIDHPDALYGLVGEMLGAARNLEQVLNQLARNTLAHQHRASTDRGDEKVGQADAWAAADFLATAAREVGQAEAALDQASGLLGRIAWQKTPQAEAETIERARHALDERQAQAKSRNWFEHPGIAAVKRERRLGL